MQQVRFFVQNEASREFSINCSIPNEYILSEFSKSGIIDIEDPLLEEDARNFEFKYSPTEIRLAKLLSYAAQLQAQSSPTMGRDSSSVASVSALTCAQVKVSGGYFALTNSRDLLFQSNSLTTTYSIKTDEILISLKEFNDYCRETNALNPHAQKFSVSFQIKVKFLNSTSTPKLVDYGSLDTQEERADSNLHNFSDSNQENESDGEFEQDMTDDEDFDNISINLNQLPHYNQYKFSDGSDEDIYDSDEESVNPKKNIEKYFRRTTNLYAGLENQGATCYLNSLLQTLYHLGILKRAISQIPFKDSYEPNDNGSTNSSHEVQMIQKNSILALQALFCEMSCNSKNSPLEYTLTTENLTKSFGWDEEDVFDQHDIQELFSILLDKLENELKHSNLTNHISSLFEGKELHYIQCLNVPYQSNVPQTFRDIQLPVEDCSDIYEGFRKYIEAEELIGQNQYKTDDFGLQDAKKGCIFQSFPPILVLHLKRFKFDPMTFSFVKNDDPYKFFDRINLMEYLDDRYKGTKEDSDYVLFCVMVQSGSMEMGHYFNYVRPFHELYSVENEGKDDDTIIDSAKWYEFNDEMVSEVDSRLAIERNFGDKRSGQSAYMLVYLRRSQIREIVTPFETENFPKHVQEIVSAIQESRRREAEKKKETRSRAFFELYSDKYIQKMSKRTSLKGIIPRRPDENGDGSKNGRELSQEEEMEYIPPSICLNRNSTFADLIQSIQNKLRLRPTIPLILWVFEERKNKSIRPMSYIRVPSADTMLHSISHFSAYKDSDSILYKKLYIQTLSHEETDDASMDIHLEACHQSFLDDSVLVFLKIFGEYGLRYFQSALIESSVQMKALFEETEGVMEEVSDKCIEEVNLEASVEDNNLINGDILIIYEKKFSTNDVKDYFFGIVFGVVVNLMPHNSSGKEHILHTRLDLTYREFRSQVADVLNCSEDKLRFYGFNDDEDCFNAYPFKSGEVETLKDMLDTQLENYHLEYEVLNESVESREQKSEFKVYLTDNNSKTKEYNLCCNPNATLLNALTSSELVNTIVPDIQNYQFLYINNHRIQCTIPHTATVRTLQEGKYLHSNYPTSYIRIDRKLEVDPAFNTKIVEIVQFIELSGIIYTNAPFFLVVDLNWPTHLLRTKILERLSREKAEKYKSASVVLFKNGGARIFLKEKERIGERFENTSHIGIKVDTQSKQLRIS